MNCVNKFEYAQNGGVVSTMVLVYQALHDYFHFGEKKLNKLQQCTQKRAEAFDNLSEDGKEKLFNSLRNELLDNVLKMQLVDDFIIHMIKMFAMPVKCNCPRLLKLVKYWKKNIRKSTSSLGNGALNNSYDDCEDWTEINFPKDGDFNDKRHKE